MSLSESRQRLSEMLCLGHVTASFTLNVYASTSEQMMRDTAARMQSYYDGLSAKR